MLRAAFLLLSCLFVTSVSQAQDTVVVRTLTFDSTSRAGFYLFPPKDGASFEKVLMQYRMRCKGGLVSTGSDRNKGCGEWDYNCETFLTDSSRVDSLKSTWPSAWISQWSAPDFPTAISSVKNRTVRTEREVSYSGSPAASTTTIGSGGAVSMQPFSTPLATRSFYILTAAELADLKLGGKRIDGLNFTLAATGTPRASVTIRMKNTTASVVNESMSRDTDLVSLYANTSALTSGLKSFYFYKPFYWDGTSNVEVEITSTSSSPIAISVPSGPSAFLSALTAYQIDSVLLFSGNELIALPKAPLLAIHNAITISVWAKGDTLMLPGNNCTFAEGVDAQNNRQVNIHLPWSDGQVYWDCGGSGGGFDRINLAITKRAAAGQWNHWAFTKNAISGKMSIYLNGVLIKSDTGKHSKIDLQRMNLGASSDGRTPYYGALNNFQMWSTELDSTAIRAIMTQGAPSDLTGRVLALGLNEGEGLVLENKGSIAGNPRISGVPLWTKVRGPEVFTGFTSSNTRPVFGLVQINDSTLRPTVRISNVYDTIPVPAHTVIDYRIVGNDSIQVIDTTYRYVAGEYYSRNESGVIVDSFVVFAADTLHVKQLPYFSKGPQKFELMSFVTPYGIGLDLGKDGTMWEFDVTDYLPVLHGGKRLSVERGSTQEELDIRFLFIKGKPAHDVLDIQQVWPMTEEGYQTILSNGRYEPRSIYLRPDARSYKLRSMITGHGQEGEFIPRTHQLVVDFANGTDTTFSREVWKDCATNPLYPQGGTWVYARSGWCPGAPTDLAEYALPTRAHPGDSIVLDYTLVTATGDSRYDPSTQLVSYGAPNRQNDAAIAMIKRPSGRIEYKRINPACDLPIVTLRNDGAQDLKSADVEYYITGGLHKTYHWTGSLHFLDTMDVVLPVDSLTFWGTNLTGIFNAVVSNPNGVADEYAQNNTFTSTFAQPPVYKGTIVVNFKSNAVPEQNYYEIRDMSGKTVFEKSEFDVNTSYFDSLILAPGCYSFIFHDDGDNGINFWATPDDGAGSLRFRQDTKTGKVLNTFNPDFGRFIQYDFSISASPLAVGDNAVKASSLSVYPNPAHQQVTVEASGLAQGMYVVEIIDATGRVVRREQRFTEANGKAKAIVDLQRLAKGSYFVQISNEHGSMTGDFVIQ